MSNIETGKSTSIWILANVNDSILKLNNILEYGLEIKKNH